MVLKVGSESLLLHLCFPYPHKVLDWKHLNRDVRKPEARNTATKVLLSNTHTHKHASMYAHTHMHMLTYTHTPTEESKGYNYRAKEL